MASLRPHAPSHVRPCQLFGPSLALRSELGGYREFAPPAALAQFAESVWVHRTPADVGLPEGAMHRVLPDPSLNVTFACERDADGRVRCPRVLIIGPKTKPYVFRLSHGYEMAAVRLKLEWVRGLLDLTPAEHNDGAHDLADVAPALGAVLLHAVATARTAEEAMLALAVSLERRARRVRRPPAAAVALDVVRDTRGRVGVDEVARLTGRSTRHLRRTVRQDAGVSIKSYARIVRFLTAVDAADRAAAPAWARLAADCGYFDQSHLVRECQALCGLAPAAIHRERRDEADFSNRRRAAHR